MGTRQALRFVIVAIALACLFPNAALTQAGGQAVVDKQLEEAVSGANWRAVLDLVREGELDARHPVVRAIVGHASLATNENNAATALFLSIEDETDRDAWETWTEYFVEKHPTAFSARYLSADAKARSGKFEEALAELNAALETRPNSSLGMNARGLIRVILGKLDQAYVDFYLATEGLPEIADSHANLGALAVLTGASLAVGSGAMDAFDAALRLDPQFALVLNSRGCLLFNDGRFLEALHNFQSASDLAPNLVIARVNEGIASAYASEVELRAEAVGSNANAQIGMTQTRGRDSLGGPNEVGDGVPPDIVDALPHFSSDALRAVVAKYGNERIEQAIRSRIRSRAGDIVSINQSVAAAHRSTRTTARWQIALAYTKTFLTLRSAVRNIAQIESDGWDKLGLQASKKVSSATAPNRTAKVIVDAVATNPYSSIASSGFNIADSVLKDRIGGLSARQTMQTQEAGRIGLEVRSLNRTLTSVRTFAASSQPDVIRQMRRPGETFAQAPSAPTLPRRVDTLQPIAPIRRMADPAPGGVSSEEIARSILNEGDTAVATSFTLFY